MPLPRGFVPPCLPTKAPQPPSGDIWVHEIKHDGFRVIARKDGERVRLYSRPGNDLTYRFPLIVEALARLRSRSCIIDGEAVCCDEDGMPSFDRVLGGALCFPTRRLSVMKKLLLGSALCLAFVVPANAQSRCADCLGDGFPHPGWRQALPPQQTNCIRNANARYGSSTIALENAVRACRTTTTTRRRGR
jgi:hypothetical protein